MPGPAPDLPDAEASPLRRSERALELMLTHRGNPSAEVELALAGDPNCTRAHCLRAALIVAADRDAARSQLGASVAAIEAIGDAHARRHAAAARAWLEGEPALALERYGALVIDRPHDILALAVAHALDFRLGRRTMLCDRIAQALPAWTPTEPNYASVLSMYAFGLEENGQYDRAESSARRALALDPGHLGAIHVVAHVMEMQGRAREGLDFLAATEPAWREVTGYSVHLAWHRALFHLDADDPRSAMAVYDSQIADASAADASVLADASALLWRLQLRGVDVSARWRNLADRWETRALSGARPFYVVHAMMAFASTRRSAATTRALQALPHVGAGAAPLLPEEALAPPLTKALLAFADDDYSACIDWLLRVRHIAHRCGGSVAQCDLIHLTFTEAALRAHETSLARTLVSERATLKPGSRLNRLLQRRLRMNEIARQGWSGTGAKKEA